MTLLTLLLVTQSAGSTWAQHQTPWKSVRTRSPQKEGNEGALLATGRTHRDMVFEGFVLGPNSVPAAGVMVVSSAGGNTTTNEAGRYRLSARVPADALTVRIEALPGADAGSGATVDVASELSASTVPVPPLRSYSEGGCFEGWSRSFGEMPGVNSAERLFGGLCEAAVHAVAVFDDGSGPALYVGGEFDVVGGLTAPEATRFDALGLARWDGASWSTVGTAEWFQINAMTVFDAGDGPALYLAGSGSWPGGFALGVYKWDGDSWSEVGVADGVRTLTVVDDGSGAALYAGGTFTSIGGASANRVAKWDGVTWSALGAGVNNIVECMAPHDDGSGEALFVGGWFTSAGGISANRIAKWDGTGWSPLGPGMTHNGTTPRVEALISFDDGSGSALYAGGVFQPNGPSSGPLAKWDGTTWSEVGNLGSSNEVVAFGVFDSGSGSQLYLGQLNAPPVRLNGGVTETFLAVFGLAFCAPAEGIATFGESDVFVIEGVDFGGGQQLCVGGNFETRWGFTNSVGAAQVHGIALWDGTDENGVMALGTGFDEWINWITVEDLGQGPAVYFGGLATAGGGSNQAADLGYQTPAYLPVFRWDGNGVTALGTKGFNDSTFDLVAFDDGTGPALYAAGPFNQLRDVADWNNPTPMPHLAKWDGVVWSSPAAFDDWVNRLLVHDDGGGPSLYAGGWFTSVDGVTAPAIAEWDGTAWSSLGTGIEGWGFDVPGVYTMLSYDDGSGPQLYAGGYFGAAGGVPAANVARWDGSSWSALCQGYGDDFDAVFDLAFFDDGSGPALYAGGTLGLRRWNGTDWSVVGGNVFGDGGSVVWSLAVHESDSHSELIVSGPFDTAGGLAVNHIARWTGSWSALGGGLSIHGASNLLSYDDGSGPALYVVGGFTSVVDTQDSFLGRWYSCPPDTVSPELTCPTEVTTFDRLSDGPGEIVTFIVTATDDVDPDPEVLCVPPSGSLFLPGTTLVDCTATDASGNVSTCQFPVHVEADRAPATKGPR